MPHFPGRSVVEPLMPIKLLPYTQGVSSTMLRAQLLKNGMKPKCTTGDPAHPSAAMNGSIPVAELPDKKNQ